MGFSEFSVYLQACACFLTQFAPCAFWCFVPNGTVESGSLALSSCAPLCLGGAKELSALSERAEWPYDVTTFQWLPMRYRMHGCVTGSDVVDVVGLMVAINCILLYPIESFWNSDLRSWGMARYSAVDTEPPNDDSAPDGTAPTAPVSTRSSERCTRCTPAGDWKFERIRRQDIVFEKDQLWPACIVWLWKSRLSIDWNPPENSGHVSVRCCLVQTGLSHYLLRLQVKRCASEAILRSWPSTVVAEPEQRSVPALASLLHCLAWISLLAESYPFEFV